MNRIEKCGLCGNAVTHTFDIWNGNSSSDRLNEEVQDRRGDDSSKICQSCLGKFDRFCDFRGSRTSQLKHEPNQTIELLSSSSDEEDVPIPTECDLSDASTSDHVTPAVSPTSDHAAAAIMCIDVTDTDSDNHSREQMERRKSKKKKRLDFRPSKMNEIFERKNNNKQFPIECSHSKCSGMFENEFAMKHHCRTYHEFGRKKSLSCYLCGLTKSNINCLRQHMNAVHGRQKRFSCSVPGCPALFKFTSAIPVHMKIVHSDKLVVSTKNKQIVNGKLQNVNISGEYMIKCSWKLCPTFFDTRDSMMYHVVTYHARGIKKVFECYLCEYIAGDRTDINRHMNLKHSQHVSYKCPMPGCRRKYYVRSSFLCHINRTHAGKLDRPLKNKEFRTRCRTKGCRERFRNEKEMSCHMKTYHRHTKKRSFQCHLCRKTISNIQKLKRHLNLTHKRPSNMPCPMPDCDLKFATIFSIGAHLRYHHGQSQTFNCLMCAKVLLNKESFMVHMSKIHGK